MRCNRDVGVHREEGRQACGQCANKHAEYEQARADRSWRGKEEEGIDRGAVRLVSKGGRRTGGHRGVGTTQPQRRMGVGHRTGEATEVHVRRNSTDAQHGANAVRLVRSYWSGERGVGLRYWSGR